MKQAVIVAHPNPKSFNLAVATAFADAARASGGDVVFRDLYATGFDPCLTRQEMPDEPDFRTPDVILQERALLHDVEAFVFVYPFWFNSPPAMLKGYIDRVFGFGFGFGLDHSGNGSLLNGRKLLSITTSGAPRQWVVDTGALDAVCALFDTHVAKVCGLSIVNHVHLGSITSGMTAAGVEKHLETVRNIAKSLNSDS